MAPVYVSNLVRVDLKYTLASGQHVENVLHIENIDGGSTVEDVATKTWENWSTAIMPFLCSNVTLGQAEATDLSAAG